MQQYKIRQKAFKEIIKQSIIKTLPILLITLTAVIVMNLTNSKDKEDSINILPIIIPLIIVSLGFGIYLGAKKLKLLYQSYTLTITNNLITREQLNTQTISLYFNDITEITIRRNGDFTIKGKHVTDLIIVPAQIENYKQLEEALTQIKTITTKSSNSFLQKNRILATLLTSGLMLSVYIFNNKMIVAISGLFFIVLISWSFLEIQRNKNIDFRTKRNSWLVLIVLASVIVVMITKLIGQTNT